MLDNSKEIAIKKVNEIYHDLEAEYYVQRHPEIYIEEAVTWEYIGKTFLKGSRPLTVLDIGTGTGFVPLQLSNYLKEGDKIICTDISLEMLKVTERKMAAFPKIHQQFIKADALEVSKMNLRADIITMNSVLHHIPDYQTVLSGLEKLINKNGLFIIMHERNKLYTQNKSILLRFYNHTFQTNIFLRKNAKKALRAIGLCQKKSAWADFNEKVHKIINDKRITESELSIDDINAMVDVHDPDERGEGFDPFEIHQKFFSQYEIVSLNTYKHLGAWIDERGLLNRWVSQHIKRRYANGGALFWLIMKKTSDV